MTYDRSLLVLVMFLGLAVGACGGDDDDEEGSSAAKLESCKQLCDAQAAASCPSIFDVATCKQFCDAFTQAPSACQDAMKASSDCQLAQQDVCSTDACQVEEDAVTQACM